MKKSLLWIATWWLTSTCSIINSQACELSIEHAWLRLPPPVSDTAAAYMTLQNRCNETKEITQLTSSIASMVMLHDAHMHGMKSLRIEPNQQIIFAPHGPHIMLMGIKHAIQKDSTISMMFHFRDNHQQRVVFPVKDMRMPATSHMHHM